MVAAAAGERQAEQEQRGYAAEHISTRKDKNQRHSAFLGMPKAIFSWSRPGNDNRKSPFCRIQEALLSIQHRNAIPTVGPGFGPNDDSA